MGGGGEHSTNFSSHTLEALKAMVRDAQPGKVEEIADHWMHVYEQLAGDAADGSVRDLLDKAVADVLEYWHGAAADAFAARARTLSHSLKNGSLYAKNTAHTLRAAATDLRHTQRAVTALQDTVSMAKDGNWARASISQAKDAADKVGELFSGRDDTELKHDVRQGMSADEARAKHADTLSRGREIALQAAAHMERLGASYNVKAKSLTGPGTREPGQPVPAPDTVVPPHDVAAAGAPVVASPRTAGPSTGGRRAAGGTSPAGVVARPGAGQRGGDAAIPARPGAPPSGPQAPTPGTALDGVRGGVPTAGSPSAPPGGPVIGGATGNSGSGAGGGSGLVPGRPMVGGRGVVGGRSSRPGAPGIPPPPSGARTGPVGPAAPGASGQPGHAARPPTGAPAGPGGTGKEGGRGGRGGLARRSGGVVGEPTTPGAPGRGAQGGSGLHRSRGGALGCGAEGAARNRGPMHAPGARPDRRARDEQLPSRPDYLVEDGETWVSQRDVVPGVVGSAAAAANDDSDAPEHQRNSEAQPDGSEGSGKA